MRLGQYSTIRSGRRCELGRLHSPGPNYPGPACRETARDVPCQWAARTLIDFAPTRSQDLVEDQKSDW